MRKSRPEEKFHYPPDSFVSEANERGDRELKVFVSRGTYSRISDTARRAGHPLESFLSFAIFDAVHGDHDLLWRLRRRLAEVRSQLLRCGCYRPPRPH